MGSRGFFNNYYPMSKKKKGGLLKHSHLNRYEKEIEQEYEKMAQYLNSIEKEIEVYRDKTPTYLPLQQNEDKQNPDNV
jgi:hypothetical protein